MYCYRNTNTDYVRDCIYKLSKVYKPARLLETVLLLEAGPIRGKMRYRYLRQIATLVEYLRSYLYWGARRPLRS